ncbi:hypothetical protein ATZ36_12460 [Candidatus Endomicrobiellum trichonymphae]|uniref:Uncharacterized protein n=1 Tax=Endomicrobium trichonymphae TaxID=1408204 RepID=A0A1E5IMY9_ENDTX|nr:hypothetical protein ATZ36_12460 [Candidatus Endomicrobium trichonymphae]
MALGQIFYSLSIKRIDYGSIYIVPYSNKSNDIISSAKNIMVLDTMAPIIAALLIIPAAFAFGKDHRRQTRSYVYNNA